MGTSHGKQVTTNSSDNDVVVDSQHRQRPTRNPASATTTTPPTETTTTTSSTSDPSATRERRGSATVDKSFLPPPHALPEEMDSINWKKYLDEVTNLDVLEALETQIDKFRDAVQAAVAKLCKPFETMPSDTQLLYQKQPCGDAERKSRIVQTVPYILKILPRAHVSKTLKKNVRTILSLDTYFTTNLGWAGQWGAFRDGCRNTLLALGQPLERAYEEGNLRQLLGDFNPVPEAAESDPNEGADKPVPYPPTTATATVQPSSSIHPTTVSSVGVFHPILVTQRQFGSGLRSLRAANCSGDERCLPTTSQRRLSWRQGWRFSFFRRHQKLPTNGHEDAVTE